MSLPKQPPIVEIRACAFCGGIPRLIKCGDQKEYFVYLCSFCYESPVRHDEARLMPKEARKIWNKRTEEAEYIINTYKRVHASKMFNDE
jgi:hypothetical protein